MTIPDSIPVCLKAGHKVSLSGFCLRDLAFVFISVLAMFVLSSNADPLFAQTAGENGSQEASTMTTNESKTFRDSKTKVSFQYPSDWEIASDEYLNSIYEEDSERPVVLIFPKSLDGTSFSILYQELPFSISANEFVKAAKKDLEKSSSEEEVSMSKNIPISVGSLEGYKYNVTIPVPDGIFEQTQIVFTKGSKVFIIAYNLGQTDVAKDLGDIQQMIDSFEINNSNKEKTENVSGTEEDSVSSSSNTELENAKDKGKAILINIFSKMFPQTGDKFSNSNYGVEIAYPKNWTGSEMKIVFPMAVVSPGGFNITEIFSPFVDSVVDEIADSIISTNGTELSEQEFRNLMESKVEQSGEALSNNAMESMQNLTSSMGVFIYDKEFARLMNSIDPNNTKLTDSLTTVYERLVDASDPTISCARQSLNQITLINNISAEVSREQCSYTNSDAIDNNLNYFVLTPDAIVGIQYTSDKNSEDDKFLPEFEESLKTLAVKESLPINNQTIQQFLSD